MALEVAIESVPQPPLQTNMSQLIDETASWQIDSVRYAGLSPLCSSRGASKSSAARSAPFSIGDLIAQGYSSQANLMLEVSALQGLTAEVATWQRGLLGHGEQLPGLSRSSDHARSHTSLATQCSFKSNASVLSGMTAAAEAAEGVRPCAPVGARHRNAKAVTSYDAGNNMVTEIDRLQQRLNMALSHTSSLVTGLEELPVAHAAEADPIQRSIVRRGEDSAGRTNFLRRQMAARLEENQGLCEEARDLGLRALSCSRISPPPCSLGGQEAALRLRAKGDKAPPERACEAPSPSGPTLLPSRLTTRDSAERADCRLGQASQLDCGVGRTA